MPQKKLSTEQIEILLEKDRFEIVDSYFLP
jgi:hypothetical protein